MPPGSSPLAIRRRPPVARLEHQILQSATPPPQPRHILEAIVWHKEKEVAELRTQTPLPELQKQVAQAPPVRDFAQALRQSPHAVSLIAEVKKASPSKGVLRADFDPVAIAHAYAAAGASCLSVLTDRQFFQGSGDYLRQIRQVVGIPILCKEFILYPYQILWARTLGADAVLLIAAILNDHDLGYFLKLIRQLGMTALIEVHTLAELDRVLRLPTVDLIGINNRDLTTFQVSLETTQQLMAARHSEMAARQITIVSESGIHTPADWQQLQRWGVRSMLVGEALVKQPDPGQATHTLLCQG
ncbi:MAG: indole-3-glycerol phosphate synthase TrpC [Cyanobacteriota bacterium]|nr:indole-3-glycerol phosphate synthase TrpC [Cyanobacteriota bacterium]